MNRGRGWGGEVGGERGEEGSERGGAEGSFASVDVFLRLK